MDPELEPLIAEYRALCHAMQTGVAYDLEKDPSSGTPKHLRVGVNSSMVDHAALAMLLVKKGIITLSEYYAEMIVKMREEVKSYEKRLAERYGAKITLL